MMHPKFLTNLGMEAKWKHFERKELPEEKARCKLLKKLEPPAGVEPATY
jgi:hypothetical protein